MYGVFVFGRQVTKMTFASFSATCQLPICQHAANGIWSILFFGAFCLPFLTEENNFVHPRLKRVNVALHVIDGNCTCGSHHKLVTHYYQEVY